MKKKTIVIVSLTLVLAILAVAVIATFPTYLFEDTVPQGDSPVIQSGAITESDKGEGDDVVNLTPDGNNNSGAEAVLPTIDDEELGYSETPIEKLETIAEAKNIKVLAEYGAFEKGTDVKIKKLGFLNKAYYRSRHYLKGIAKEFTAYNLSAKKDGKTIVPNGAVKLVFEIPEKYNSRNVAVYYLLDRGVQEIDCEISDDGKTATAKVSQTGVYILVEKIIKEETPSNTSSEDTATQSGNNSSDGSSNTSEPTSTDSSDSTGDNSSDGSSDTQSGTLSDGADTSSEQTSSNTSSDTSSDSTSSDVESDDTSSDSNTSSDISSDDASSDSDTSSDTTSSEDPNKETMNGWTPWR